MIVIAGTKTETIVFVSIHPSLIFFVASSQEWESSYAPSIYEDNSGAVSIAKSGNFTKSSKYIEVHYYFVNENYEKVLIDIVKVSSEKNVTDILTKVLGKLRFKNCENY